MCMQSEALAKKAANALPNEETDLVSAVIQQQLDATRAELIHDVVATSTEEQIRAQKLALAMQ